MNQGNLTTLFEKYLSGSLSEDEFKILWETLQQPEYKEKWAELAATIWEDNRYRQEADEETRQRILSKLQPVILESRDTVVPMRRNKSWWTVAAAAIILLGISAYWFLDAEDQKNTTNTSYAVPGGKIAPGSNKAMLTLSNGSKLELDSAADGLLANQGQAGIFKKKDGELVYRALNKEDKEVYYNTITTPRGGQYKVVLPDGTAVWLNAASSISYPVGFDANERNVTITGEVYFEVAKDKKRPFRVLVDNMTIEVLGTHFNVMAYSDEMGKTTLLEGAVRLSRNGKTTLLKPGQQAQVKNNGNIAVQGNINLEETVAWKDGLFLFSSADIGTIMRQAGRWYDVNIEYRGKCSKLFSGEISRSAELADLLAILEETDEVSFSVQDHTIIVIPKQQKR
ncbi:MAG: FecR family protein [Chitinophagaceae bacterium]|nr:FecR family protein [Chitinophagaceae bacterium]